VRIFDCKQLILPSFIAAAYTFLSPASPDVGKDGKGRRYRCGAGSGPEEVPPNTG